MYRKMCVCVFKSSPLTGVIGQEQSKRHHNGRGGKSKKWSRPFLSIVFQPSSMIRTHKIREVRNAAQAGKRK